MIYRLAEYLRSIYGPARLLQSYGVLVIIAICVGFLITVLLLPKFYNILPHDRGREFSLGKEAGRGKPTGSGLVFITIFVLLAFLIAPVNICQSIIIILTWLMMLTGYLDDRSKNGWGEYRKGCLDLILSIAASVTLYYLQPSFLATGKVYFWLPFLSNQIIIAPWVYILVGTILIWISINTTNCTDGVDGLSSTLVLIALLTLGGVFYFVLGHVEISEYLLIPSLSTGALWGVITFALAGTLMGYLWHNAFPSKVMMGDAGSRALGFYIGVAVMVTGNPFIILATSLVIFLNGGMGLLKIALLRFLHIKIFSEVRFPLHDHFRKNHDWSPTQILIKFMIIQLLSTVAILGILFKVR
ncbi:MAG: phospho-N-acetylmuramoyl-pentapeptide-transferase [Treponema sp. CETP13]|nr:MAG: phospho-N-acetylmuramoyl-pentapeptide-transferase [Treponema sp. CETP13]